jgi:transcriptional regulator with GAF, ATPase, and Fis domain
MTTIEGNAQQTAFEQVDAIQDLLPTLASGLDVRDIFQHLSRVASRIVPHDEADLWLATEDGSGVRLYATTHSTPSDVVCLAGTRAIAETDQPRVLDVVPGAERGLQSGLSVPVRIDGRLVGCLVLFSRRSEAYSGEDLLHADRLAGYVAVALSHQRLAEQARDAAVERDRAATVETSIGLLRAIADVLDIRTVFPRISEIANKVLPHDALMMVFVDQDGHIVRQAVSSDDLKGLPSPPTWLKPNTQPYGELVINDLRTESLPSTAPDNVREHFVRAGYRSILGVFARARQQEIIVSFCSKQPHAFNQRDVPVAQRIVDYIALAVSHEQLAEAAQQIAEAHARADQLEKRVHVLSKQLESNSHLRIVGESREWHAVLKKATQVAATDTTVLLTGESGTGKEVVARFIHRASPRSTGPFVALNCAALPEQLLESELFGYERGAFTGAVQAKPGQIELASGGVLFLDEVSEMSLSAQAKFLRVLQDHEFQRLGGTRSLNANIRVVAATNRDLPAAVERGAFREDLFYRLQVFDIQIAPLRERRADILPLAEAFLSDIGRSFGRPPAGLTGDAREALLRYPWPGNVRELHNALERAAILCEGGLIHSEHLTLQSSSRPPQQSTADLKTLERNTIEQTLRETRWNKAKAAKRLGLTRTALYHRIRKYRLE